MTRECQVEKMLDELEEEFAKVNMSINDTLTLFAKVSNIIYKYAEQEPCTDAGEISDGYHTFNQLYHQRAILFAIIVNQNKDIAWKSYKHSDGKYCFDRNGEWFIVGIDTPEGSYTYHYSKEYWDYFKCKELNCGKEWDGHTEEDVTRLLSLEQEPCTDAISRQAVLNAISSDRYDYSALLEYVKQLSPVTPQYTEAEIQRMQELEQAEIQKAYELGKAEQPKMGQWILTQRNKYIDINCSECGNTRFKEFAYGYIIDELNLEEVNEWIAKNRMNYCECCGAKMQEVKA